MRQKDPIGGNGMPTATDQRTPASGDVRLTEAVSRLNDYIQRIHRNLEFTVDEDANRVIVKVYNLETAEVVRVIPAEEVLSMSRYLSRQRAWVQSMGL